MSNPHSFFAPADVAKSLHEYAGLWKNAAYHIPLHLTLLHGVVPEKLLPSSATAFLGPAWSLSLEWQFYLIAPLWFGLAVSNSGWKRFLMVAGCIGVILGSERFLPMVGQRAALPFRLEYFFVGLVS